jgi:hypothetical protein
MFHQVTARRFVPIESHGGIRGVLLSGGVAAICVLLFLEAIDVTATWIAWSAAAFTVLVRVALRVHSSFLLR